MIAEPARPPARLLRPAPCSGPAMLLLAAAGLVAFVLLLYMVSPLISPKPLALPGAHVVVSGPPAGRPLGLLLLLRPRAHLSRGPAPARPGLPGMPIPGLEAAAGVLGAFPGLIDT